MGFDPTEAFGLEDILNPGGTGDPAGTLLNRGAAKKKKKADKKAAKELAATEAELARLEEASEEEQRGLLRAALSDRASLFSTLSTGQGREIGGSAIPRPAPAPRRPIRDPRGRPNRPGRPRMQLL